MSSTEFKIDKPFFIDPATGHVITYGKFRDDLVRESVVDGTNSTYSTLVIILASIFRGNDFCVGDGQVTNGTAEPGPSVLMRDSMPGGGVGSASAEVGGPGANAHPLIGSLLRQILDSESQIRLATSGTTGQPKQVTHSIQSLTRGVRIGPDHQSDVWGLAYPLDHLAGLQVLFQALFNQNTIVHLYRLPGEQVHQAIEDYGVTHLSCTPTFLKLLASDTDRHLDVKRLTTGGERIDRAALSVVDRVFPAARHRNIYALTEVGNLLIADGEQFTVPPELREKVSVIDGGLAIHRSLLADQRPEAGKSLEISDESLESGKLHSDWFLTGDLVEVLAEQPLTFTFLARRDDVINVGGYKVIPQQVEECLSKLPQVRQAAAYGKRNSVTGQIVVCDVVLEPGADWDPAAAKQTMSEVLPRYAVPRIFNIVESLSMTPNGKLCRRNETS